ncbi:MAG TPA: hypothetical protein PKZ07_01045 [Sedimentisphaerales bacterium]|nr:hypothetical protein [Sedimentisphaerales bacterium]
MRGFAVFSTRLWPGWLRVETTADIFWASTPTPWRRESFALRPIRFPASGGANALYPEAGEPQDGEDPGESKEGFSSALWRRSREITTADCRNMLAEAGFEAVVVSPQRNWKLT